MESGKMKRISPVMPEVMPEVTPSWKPSWNPPQQTQTRLKRLLTNFAENTACHGVVHIYTSRYLALKVLWTLMFLGALAMMIVQMAENIQRYYEFPIKTRITVQHTALPFPTVTICNVNPIRHSESYRAPSYLRKFIASVSPLVHVSNEWEEAEERRKRFINVDGWKSNFSEEDFIDYDSSGDGELEDAHATLTSMYRQFIARVEASLRYELAHSLKHMLISCAFEGHVCEATDFKRSLSHDFGACYSFNAISKAETKARIATQSGNKNGLQLMLYLESNEYIPGLTDGYGFRVAITRAGTLPFPETNGLFVSAGSETDIGIRLTNISRLGPPYRKCVDDLRFRDEHGVRYSRQHCRTLCEHNNTAHKCSCYKRGFTEFYTAEQIGRLSPCSKHDVACVNEVIDSLTEEGLPCYCPSPCLEHVYETVLSNRRWPELNYMRYLLDKTCENVPDHCEELLKSKEEVLRKIYNDALIRLDNLACANSDFVDYGDGDFLFTCSIWWGFRKNFAKLNIFYRDLNYEKIQDEPEITVCIPRELPIGNPSLVYITCVIDLGVSTTLLSMSGGTIAFWIGMSVLSLVEVLQLLVQIFLYFIQRCFNRCNRSNVS